MSQTATIDRIAASIIDGSPQSKRGAKDDRPAVKVVTYEPGLRVAQKVDFTSAVFGYSDVIPIHKMELRLPQTQHAEVQPDLSHEIDTSFAFFRPVHVQPAFPEVHPSAVRTRLARSPYSRWMYGCHLQRDRCRSTGSQAASGPLPGLVYEPRQGDLIGAEDVASRRDHRDPVPGSGAIGEIAPDYSLADSYRRRYSPDHITSISDAPADNVVGAGASNGEYIGPG